MVLTLQRQNPQQAVTLTLPIKITDWANIACFSSYFCHGHFFQQWIKKRYKWKRRHGVRLQSSWRRQVERRDETDCHRLRRLHHDHRRQRESLENESGLSSNPNVIIGQKLRQQILLQIRCTKVFHEIRNLSPEKGIVGNERRFLCRERRHCFSEERNEEQQGYR